MLSQPRRFAVCAIFFRSCHRRQSIHLARLADVPVLAELATQIAACGAEGKNGGTRQKVIQGFLLDRIDAKTAGSSVCGQDNRVVFSGAHKAEAPLAFVEAAEARTDIALHTAVIEQGPVAGGNGMGRFKVFHFRIEKENGRGSSQR